MNSYGISMLLVYILALCGTKNLFNIELKQGMPLQEI